MIGDDAPPPVGIGAQCQYNGTLDPHHLEGYVTMAWSTSLLGPWTKSRHLILTSGATDEWDAIVTNPAPLFPYKDKTTAYVYYRGTQVITSVSVTNSAFTSHICDLLLSSFPPFRFVQWPVNGLERIGLTKAETWRGPYGRISDDPLWGPFNDSKVRVCECLAVSLSLCSLRVLSLTVSPRSLLFSSRNMLKIRRSGVTNEGAKC